VLLLFSGCNVGIRVGPQEPDLNAVEPLTFVVPRELLELDITPDTNATMSALQQIVKEDPYMGPPGNFHFVQMGTHYDYNRIVFLAINRLGGAIVNVSFDLTFHRAGEAYVVPVELTEEIIGIIPNHVAVPILLTIASLEEFEQLRTLLLDAQQGVASMSIENLVANSAR